MKYDYVIIVFGSTFANSAKKEKNVIFNGRLAEYKYYDMDDVIKSAFDIYKKNKKTL